MSIKKKPLILPHKGEALLVALKYKDLDLSTKLKQYY